LFKSYTEKLYDILFAHKVNKLMNENPYVNRKKEIIVETLNKNTLIWEQSKIQPS